MMHKCGVTNSAIKIVFLIQNCSKLQKRHLCKKYRNIFTEKLFKVAMVQKVNCAFVCSVILHRSTCTVIKTKAKGQIANGGNNKMNKNLAEDTGQNCANNPLYAT